MRKSQRKDARMSCSRRWPALPSHATAPRSASCSPRCRRRKHVDVRCPARQRRAGTSPSPTRSGPLALIRRSAATGLSRSRATRAAYPCRTLTGISRLWISSTRTAPSYIYALYMLMLEHVSSVVTDQAFCSGHHANDSRQSSQYCPVHRAPRKFPSADE